MIYDQQIRIDRAFSQDFFLIDHKDTMNEFIYNISGSTANLYTVKIKNNPSEMDFNDLINCDCPDSTTGAKQKGVKCKHCCFMLLKVLKINVRSLDKNYMDGKSVNVEEIIEACKNMIVSGELINETYQRRYLSKTDNIETKSEFIVTKEIESDSDCPICFDEMIDRLNSQCPTCSNIVHTKCIEKWLAFGNNSCPYCRGDWSNFNKKISKTKIGDYLNLSMII